MLGMRCMRPADLAATAPRRRLGPSPPACGAPVLQRHLPLRPAPDPGGVGQLQMAHGAGTRDCGGGDRGRRRRDRLQGGLGSPLLLALKQAQWAGGGGGRAILGNHGAQGLWAQHRGVLRPSAATIAAHCAPSLLTPPPTHTHTHTRLLPRRATMPASAAWWTAAASASSARRGMSSTAPAASSPTTPQPPTAPSPRAATQPMLW